MRVFKKIAELERRLMEGTLAKGLCADDAIEDRIQRSEDQAERYWRVCDVLRHQI